MINMTHGTVKIFAGNGCPDLAKAIADRLELPLGQLEATRFSDGEICVNIKETVRGCDVFVVQSTSTPVNDNLMELLVMIDAFKRASCNKLTVVMPYFGYARQDRKARARDPITAKLVANLLEKAGADRVLTMDLHSTQLQGFFDIPVDNLLGMPVLAKYFLKNGFKNDDLVIVSPDVGSVTRSRSMAAKFNAPLAIIDKRRPKANVMEVMNIIGDVKDKVCLMLDDMIDTADTIKGSFGRGRKRGLRLLFPRSFQRSGNAAHTGQPLEKGGHTQHYSAASGQAHRQNRRGFRCGNFCRGNRKDLFLHIRFYFV